MIANMGAELSATTTSLPVRYKETLHFLHSEGRAADWRAITTLDADCSYDDEDEIDLSELEPLVATPSSPGNVVKIGEIEGKDVYQAYIGSSANPGWRGDFAVAAEIVRGKTVPSNVSFDVNPTSRQLLETLIADGRLGALVAAGARIHQTGCNGCIGMGQAPAVGQNSLQHHAAQFSRPLGHGRGDLVDNSAASPEAGRRLGAVRPHYPTPWSLEMPYPRLADPEAATVSKEALLSPPPPTVEARLVERLSKVRIFARCAGVRSASRQSDVTRAC